MTRVCHLGRNGKTGLTAIALAALCVFASGSALSQTTGAANSPAPHRRTTSVAPGSQARSKAASKAKKEAETAPVVPVRPPDPPPPDWPANKKAAPATVEWNGHALKISAANSSLSQILKDVSSATGVQVEGMGEGGSDQRVYGSFGPATARDVLSQLLDGSAYNVLMVGEQGEGTPRQLVLTKRTGGGTPSNPGAGAEPGQNAEDEAPEEPEQPEQPDPNARRPFPGPGQMPGRNPQQMIQEMQQRQMQIQQQQQQQPQPQDAPQQNH